MDLGKDPGHNSLGVGSVKSSGPGDAVRAAGAVRSGDHALAVFHSGRDSRVGRRSGGPFGGIRPVFLGQKGVRRALRHPAQNASLVSEPFTGKPK